MYKFLCFFFTSLNEFMQPNQNALEARFPSSILQIYI